MYPITQGKGAMTTWWLVGRRNLTEDNDSTEKDELVPRNEEKSERAIHNDSFADTFSTSSHPNVPPTLPGTVEIQDLPI